jgi:hypothetical protein
MAQVPSKALLFNHVSVAIAVKVDRAFHGTSNIAAKLWRSFVANQAPLATPQQVYLLCRYHKSQAARCTFGATICCPSIAAFWTDRVQSNLTLNLKLAERVEP